ncbi:MAG: hypothetical protein CSA79_00110 [Thiothrix nivea]|nr:MAG: hypothetical protein CSA79_00110 [Thiothrix nivea]
MAAFIMAGPLQAFAFVVLFALAGLFLPLIGLLSNAALGLVTLRLGANQGLKIAAGATLGIGILILLIPQQAIAALGSTLLQWTAVIALAMLLQQTLSWQRVLTTVLGVSAGIILLFHALIGDVGEFWRAFILPMVEMPVIKEQFPDINLDKAVAVAAEFMTGVLAALLNLGIIISLMIARHWQALLYNPGGFRDEFRELHISRPVGLVMLLLVTVGLLTSMPAVIDIIVAGMTVFLFQGLSLIHSTHQRLKLHIGWLIGFYVILLLMPVQLGILLAAFGIIDSVANFRSLMPDKTP